jgi:hypothetical protein
METVNIRPGVNILSVLGHLNYKHWYALGEFVDNSVNSGIERNWNRLQSMHDQGYKLRVDIEIDKNDGGRIVIRDNAAGIASVDYQRAFRTAEIPLDRTGLSEFGMGMKSAGFWFTNTWTVRTKAIGEKRAGKIHFDLSKIMDGGLETLPVEEEPAKMEEHFTELILLRPAKMPVKKTIAKIKEHLTSIYRQFLKEGKLEIYYDGGLLHYEEPKVLEAANPRDPSGKVVVWKKQVDIRLAGNKRIHGFVAIREEAKMSEAGLALFRRGRLILGSGDEGYRPTSVFGQPNSYRYQRVFGELHVEGFGVSHTKDAIQWEDLEEDFLVELRKQMDAEPLPILKMAEEYRARTRTTSIVRAAQSAAASTAQALGAAQSVIDGQRHEQAAPSPLPVSLPVPVETAATKEFNLTFLDQEWIVTIDLANDPAIEDWLDISQNQRSDRQRLLKIRVNLAHPFMQRFSGASGEQIEPILRVAAALAIAETIARDVGVRLAGTIRQHVNELLRKALSAPIETNDDQVV